MADDLASWMLTKQITVYCCGKPRTVLLELSVLHFDSRGVALTVWRASASSHLSYLGPYPTGSHTLVSVGSRTPHSFVCGDRTARQQASSAKLATW